MAKYKIANVRMSAVKNQIKRNIYISNKPSCAINKANHFQIIQDKQLINNSSHITNLTTANHNDNGNNVNKQISSIKPNNTLPNSLALDLRKAKAAMIAERLEKSICEEGHTLDKKIIVIDKIKVNKKIKIYKKNNISPEIKNRFNNAVINTEKKAVLNDKKWQKVKDKAVMHHTRKIMVNNQLSKIKKKIEKAEKTTNRKEKIAIGISTAASGVTTVAKTLSSIEDMPEQLIRKFVCKNKVGKAALKAADKIGYYEENIKADNLADAAVGTTALPEKIVKDAVTDKITTDARNVLTGRSHYERLKKKEKKLKSQYNKEEYKARKAERAANKAKDAALRKSKLQFYKENKGIIKSPNIAVNIKNACQKFVKQATTIANKIVVEKAKKIVLAVLAPLLIIVLIVIIVIALFYSWVQPITYILAGNDSKYNSDTNQCDPFEANSEEEIILGYVLQIQNYMDIAQAKYKGYYYGNYSGGSYQWDNADLDVADYISYMRNKIRTELEAAWEETINNAEGEKKGDAIMAREQAIGEAIAEMTEAASDYVNSLLEHLNDMYSPEPQYQPWECPIGGAFNFNNDSDEFGMQPVVGTNHFGNTEIKSELSAEDLTALIAISKVIQSAHSSENDEDYIMTISVNDINQFFVDTEFFNIDAYVVQNSFTLCSSGCKRRLVGSWEDGWEWEFYCDSPHRILYGEIKPCKNLDEMLETIVDVYDGESVGIDLNSCKELYNEYSDYIYEKIKKLEDTPHLFGAADSSRSDIFYEDNYKANPTEPSPASPWITVYPLEIRK